jgi:hypothetical protein
MNNEVLECKHKESACNYITGITENNLIDIIEGKYIMGSPYGVKFDVPVKVEFKKHKPYYQLSRGNKVYNIENEEFALEYKAKRYKMKFIDNDYFVELEWENLGADGKHFWSRSNNNLTITNEYKQQIRNKLEQLKVA